MLENMVYYESGSTNPAFNLALEEALAGHVRPNGPGCFMLWQNAPAVIIGLHQNARAEVNLAELASRGIKMVRRLTGGGAVYHDLGNLNFTFILPQKQGERITNGELLAPLLGYLASLGLEAGMEGRNDITLKGKGKISGLASRQTPGKYLLHGTILYNVDMGALESVLLVDPAKYKSKGVHSVRARVTNLHEHTGAGLTGLWQGIRRAYPAKDGELPDSVQALAARLEKERYSQDAWNLGMSPPGDIRLTTRFPFGSLELNIATRGSAISAAQITGDFLTPSNTEEQIPVTGLAEALVGLPSHDHSAWAEAWENFDFSRIFYNCENGGEILTWLRQA